MSLSGSYIFYEEENFIQLLKTNGIDLKPLEGKKPTLDITQDGSKYSIVRTMGDDISKLNFTLNEKFKENVFGKSYEAIAVLEDNVLKISTTGDTEVLDRYYIVTKEGIEVQYKYTNGQAAVRYKRI